MKYIQYYNNSYISHFGKQLLYQISIQHISKLKVIVVENSNNNNIEKMRLFTRAHSNRTQIYTVSKYMVFQMRSFH